MRKTVFMTRAAALITVLFILTGIFSSCRKQEEEVPDRAVEEITGEDVSDRVKELVSTAFELQKSAHCRASARSYAIVKSGAQKKFVGSYLQTFERLIDFSREKPAQNVTSYYAGGLRDPGAASGEELRHFYDCFIEEGYCYFDYGSSKKVGVFDRNYLSHIGLYSIAGLSPESMRAVKTESDYVATLVFSSSACDRSQELFIRTMLTALFNTDELDIGWSSLTFRAHIDPETGNFNSYALTFSGIPISEPEIKIDFVYEEEFTAYGTEEEIRVPDVSQYS